MLSPKHQLLMMLPALLILQFDYCIGLSQQSKATYNYFAYGSNMCSSTMINLRKLSPLASTAAILPAHTLRFNIAGIPLVEPSSASVEPSINKIMDVGAMIERDELVHGVLYKLNEKDFASVCSTEGVPFAYSLHRCRPIPYSGDGLRAGEKSLRNLDYLNIPSNEWGVAAFTLRAARQKWREGNDIPPSQSYLNVLIRGAKEFALDGSYLEKLQQIDAGRTFPGNGLAEELLRRAEERTR
ncbi:hypothetical protein ACHAWT_004571 [Skeletonema menzelii]